MNNDQRNAATFGAAAAQYAAARPRYPDLLFDWLAELPLDQDLAWDVGCGNGQATTGLAARFRSVIASDVSAEQIALAPRLANVRYVVAAAERMELPAGHVDLAIAANALHWFDRDLFFPLLTTALRPGGVFAAIAYGRTVLPEPLRDPVRAAYAFLEAFWANANRLVWSGYEGLHLPLDDVPVPALSIDLEWTLDQWLDYSSTWSAYRRYVDEVGRDPQDVIRTQLAPFWGTGVQPLRMPLTIKAGRKSGS